METGGCLLKSISSAKGWDWQISSTDELQKICKGSYTRPEVSVSNPEGKNMSKHLSCGISDAPASLPAENLDSYVLFKSHAPQQQGSEMLRVR